MTQSEVENTIPLKLAREVLVLSKDGIFQTIQGEGPRIGRPTTFMRLGGCNLKCSWCDTKYTWDWTQFDPRTELVPTPIHELADRIMSSRITSLTITGGEPFQQAKNLQKLFRSLLAQHYILDEINFETNGTTFPEWVEDTWGVASSWGIVISPKLTNSGKDNSLLEGTVGDVSARTYTLIRWLMQEEYLDGVGGRPLVEVDFKFVCQSSQDFVQIDRIRGIVLETGHPMLAQNIWVMPEGTNPTELTERARSMVDEVISRGWNLTPRWHQDLWSNARAK